MGCAGSKSGGEVLAVAPVAGGDVAAPAGGAGGDSGTLGIREPQSSTPLPEQGGAPSNGPDMSGTVRVAERANSEPRGQASGPDMATLMQQNQEMMRLFLLSQAATEARSQPEAQPLTPSTTAAAPVVIAPYDGGGWGVGAGEAEAGTPHHHADTEGSFARLKTSSLSAPLTEVFLTHDWANDELGRNNHERVRPAPCCHAPCRAPCCSSRARTSTPSIRPVTLNGFR